MKPRDGASGAAPPRHAADACALRTGVHACATSRCARQRLMPSTARSSGPRPRSPREGHVDADAGKSAVASPADACSRSGLTSGATYGSTLRRPRDARRRLPCRHRLPSRSGTAAAASGEAALRRRAARATPLVGRGGVAERTAEEAKQRGRRRAPGSRTRPAPRAARSRVARRLGPAHGARSHGDRRRRVASINQDRDAAGQPVDVDVELALAGRDGDAAAVAAAVGKEADRADRVVDDVVLRGEELELDPRGSACSRGSRSTLKRLPARSIDDERLAALATPPRCARGAVPRRARARRRATRSSTRRRRTSGIDDRRRRSP